MFAVIMTGGKGSRITSLTRNKIPKTLLPINGKPILQWQIECLKKNGISDVIIVGGPGFRKIHNFLKDGSKFGVRVKYFQETDPLGSGGALPYLENMIEDNTFILVYGDLIFDISLEPMINFHNSKNAIITTYIHPSSHPGDSNSLVTSRNGRITKFFSKSSLPPNGFWRDNLTNAGIYILSKEVCRLIPIGRKCDFDEYVVQPQIQFGKVYGYRSSEYIRDAGTPERFFQIENDIKNGIIEMRNLSNLQKCIFLDRDGTINVDKGLLYKIEDFELIPGVDEAVRMINDSGYLCIIITNQSVVARGLCSIGMLENIHRKMNTLLGNKGAYFDAIYYCPHHPDDGYPEENKKYKMVCGCRKPNVGMIRQAVGRFNISLEDSWMVGDSDTDMETGRNAGLQTSRLRSDNNLIEIIKRILEVY